MFNRDKLVRLRKVVGWSIIVFCLLLVVYDVITNRVNLPWTLVILATNVIGLLLVFSLKEVLGLAAALILGILSLAYVEFLQQSLSGTDIDLYGSVPGRMIAFAISGSLYFVVRFVFFEPIRDFLRNLWRMITSPGIGKVLLRFTFAYLAMTFVFGLFYASIYVFAGSTSFQSNKPLDLADFLYYSLFVPTTLGYPGISPEHWLAKLLTLLEFGLGVTAIVIYLGVVVGEISEHISLSGEND